MIDLAKLREVATITLTCEQDDARVRGNACATDDPDADRACEDEIIRRLDQGDVWAWAVVTVTATYDDHRGIAVLGGCSYASEQEFNGDGCYTDMVSEAITQLGNAITRDDSYRMPNAIQAPRAKRTR